MRAEKLSECDICDIVRCRVLQLCSERQGKTVPESLRDSLGESLYRYYTGHFQSGDFVCYGVRENGEIIATGGVSFVSKPPYFENLTGRLALISGMYTDPRFRCRGIAKDILACLCREAKNAGCAEIQVSASVMGTVFYENSGFTPHDRYLTLSLVP